MIPGESEPRRIQADPFPKGLTDEARAQIESYRVKGEGRTLEVSIARFIYYVEGPTIEEAMWKFFGPPPTLRAAENAAFNFKAAALYYARPSLSLLVQAGEIPLPSEQEEGANRR